MSTRCQIDFIVKWGRRTDKRRVYRHSDGYPEVVLNDLKDFLAWNDGRNSDVEYMTANFIYWSKRWMEQEYWNRDYHTNGVKDPTLKWSDNQPTGCSNLHIGFGVCDNTFHGDIEYYYKVIVVLPQNNAQGRLLITPTQTITIEVYDVRDGMKKIDSVPVDLSGVRT